MAEGFLAGMGLQPGEGAGLEGVLELGDVPEADVAEGSRRDGLVRR
jgi:hypothetical protein